MPCKRERARAASLAFGSLAALQLSVAFFSFLSAFTPLFELIGAILDIQRRDNERQGLRSWLITQPPTS